jgi:hypothetical protein
MTTSLLTHFQTLTLPKAAGIVFKRDAAGLPVRDPGIDSCIDAAADWLCRAQDRSASSDGGVSRDYNLMRGWATSYPETTGYIIPTLLAVSRLRDRPELADRAARMLDWLERIQLADGGFQGGRIDATPVVPVTFNTGQILIGLAAGVAHLGRSREAMERAARFLRDSLDQDGCWRSHPTPFAEPGDKAYETHVAWGLFEADRLAPDQGYGQAGMRQVAWAIGKQTANGWVSSCCLNNPEAPLTHTLGYYLKGLVEAHRWSGNQVVLDAALLTARGLLGARRADGALPGRLLPNWTPAVQWSCLTGNVQIADSWFYLGRLTDDAAMLEAGRGANAFVRRSMLMDGPEGERGGVKGAFPVQGDYGAYEYLNWAAKFAIDAFLTERALAPSGAA